MWSSEYAHQHFIHHFFISACAMILILYTII